MKMEFTKVVGSGNDFIIIDNRDARLSNDLSELAKKLCQRKTSVGADGVLLLEDSDKADLRMRIFNPDGSEVTMCGNGARCVALYSYVNKRASEKIKIETEAGILEAHINDDRVRIRMTDPVDIKLDNDLGIGNTIFKIHFVNTGVPHVVHFLQDNFDLQSYPVKEMGQKIRFHKRFQPEGTNVNFVKVIGDNRIELRTYERGVEDETLACGTGAVASSIISHLVNKTGQPVEVTTKSGDILKVYFNVIHKIFHDVHLEGSAEIVYNGEIDSSVSG